MSEKYTYADVIIDPDDPRVEIGKEYWFGSVPKQVIDKANGDNSTSMLREIRPNLERPFLFSSDMNSDIGMAPCMIRKKEPEKKYVPFDLTKEEDRAKLRGAWVREKYGERELAVTAIYMDEKPPFFFFYDNGFTAEQLLESYKFLDRSPCGRLVEE